MPPLGFPEKVLDAPELKRLLTHRLQSLPILLILPTYHHLLVLTDNRDRRFLLFAGYIHLVFLFLPLLFIFLLL